MAKQSSKTNNNKPNRKSVTIDAKKIEPKWFIYHASQTRKFGFKATFVPLPEETTRSYAYKLKEAFCIQMFSEAVARNLSFCLDPSIHKRYQKKVVIGSLDIDFFHTYFNATNCHTYTTRQQYLTANGQRIYVNCPTYTFKGFDNLPNFNKSKTYASTQWNVRTFERVDDDQMGIYYYQPNINYYAIFFSELTFFCNPITNLVYCDYMIEKRYWNETEKLWENI